MKLIRVHVTLRKEMSKLRNHESLEICSSETGLEGSTLRPKNAPPPLFPFLGLLKRHLSRRHLDMMIGVEVEVE
jgi:hypothetical protein